MSITPVSPVDVPVSHKDFDLSHIASHVTFGYSANLAATPLHRPHSGTARIPSYSRLPGSGGRRAGPFPSFVLSGLNHPTTSLDIAEGLVWGTWSLSSTLLTTFTTP
ncbi:hypothetical protein FPOA_09736 [Fusarium poae]|uniref:Uncharacterized protein n=1 Tax=Fusarium poae TaxID=36050 RepID=A0A1B8AC05_FUSPO|nr:hypothetical protein FPOA_09736 [Fusarium poae]